MTLVKGGPNSVSLGPGRLRVERAKLERALKSPHARKGDTPFLAWGDFHARWRFARPTIPEEKWGTTRSLHLYPRGTQTPEVSQFSTLTLLEGTISKQSTDNCSNITVHDSFTLVAISESFLSTMPHEATPITLTLSSLPNVISCSFTASPTCFITPAFVPPLLSKTQHKNIS